MGITEKRKAARERQQARRARMTAAGFRQITLWVHEDDAERLRAYAEELLRGRQAKA